MSRRNTDAITIQHFDWTRTTWNRHCHWRKCQSVRVTPNGTCNGWILKETGHSLGQYIRSRKMTKTQKAEGK